MKILILLLLSANLFAMEIGWKGNTWIATSNVSPPAAVEITADDQVVDQVANSVMEISSDSLNATQRDIILKCPPEAGHRITLYAVGTGAFRLGDDSALNGACTGFARLSNNWTAAKDGTLSLISTNTDYLEVSRAGN